ncbi:MAG: CDP-2,3-bis-(O-geranylgeranyl)-sn-glycerol synthase [Candidatus Woesearchaeota archaeon]
MDFIILLLKLLYFSLPIYFANMIPVIIKDIKLLDTPVDLGKKLYGNYIFGRTKTIRGILFGTLGGIFILIIQKLLYQYPYFSSISIIDYSKISVIILGFSMGFGAIFGDLVESFIKRRLNYPSGKSFFPYDQIDFILGAMFFTYFFLPNLFYWGLIILVTPILHLGVNIIAYKLKLKNEPW